MGTGNYKEYLKQREERDKEYLTNPVEIVIINHIKKFNDKWKDSISKNEPCDYYDLSIKIKNIITYHKSINR